MVDLREMARTEYVEEIVRKKRPDPAEFAASFAEKVLRRAIEVADDAVDKYNIHYLTAARLTTEAIRREFGL